MTDHADTPRSRLSLAGPPTGRATRRPARRVPRRWTGGRDQGLRPAGPGRRRHDRRVRPPRPPSSPRTRSRRRPSACRRPTSRRRPGTRAAGSAGPRRSSRRAAARTPRPGAAGDADQAEVAGCSPRRPASPVERTLHLSTGIIGTRLPLDRVAAGLATARPDARRRPTTACGRCRGAADDRLGDEGRDDVGRAAGRPTAARSGRHGQRHRQGRRDDPPADGHDAVDRPDRRAGRARPALGPAPAGRGADLEPARPSTATRARTTRSSSSPPGRRRPRRSRPVRTAAGGPRRRDRGRRPRPGPPAGGRRRRRDHADHGRGHGRRDDAEARAVARSVVVVEPGQGGGPRSRPELGPDRRCRRATRRLADAAVLEAAACRADEARGPCRHAGRARSGAAADRDRRPPRLRWRGRRSGRLRSRRGARPRWTPRGRPRASTSVSATAGARRSAAT